MRNCTRSILRAAMLVCALLVLHSGLLLAGDCGDVDNSGGIDIDDIVYLIAYVFQSGPEPIPIESGDVDGNIGIDIDDIVYLIAYVFTGGPAPICNCGTVMDIDGNAYQTVRIGDQCWLKENLKVTHYRNGDPIPHVTDEDTWSELATGAYCDYFNVAAYGETYGHLYNWYAVDDSRGLAPEGWHVPADDEWKQLEMYLGMSQSEADDMGFRGTDEGGKLKEAGTAHWHLPNTGATNESGFSALPGGYCEGHGPFGNARYGAYLWSSTKYDSSLVWERYLSYDISQVIRWYHGEGRGYSVRCLQDYPGILIINPFPDSIDAPWTIQGPSAYEMTGNGCDTLRDLESGEYSIVWSNVSGWFMPNDSTLTLDSNTTAMFFGEYIEAPDSTGTVADCDGNIYQTIKIGDQWWMAENLKVTHYRNGDPIPHVTDGGTWDGLSTGAYFNYDSDEGNVATYGRLYNWYAVDDSRNIAPAGWHVPSDDEWKQLEMYLGMSQAEADDTGWRGTDEGGKLKETGTTHWNPPNEGATNESGFSALPGGYRDSDGSFYHMGNFAHFWSSTEFSSNGAWLRYLNYFSSQVHRLTHGRPHGFSVRCVRD